MSSSGKGSFFKIFMLIFVGYILITFVQDENKKTNLEIDKAEKASRESMAQGIKLDKARLRGGVRGANADVIDPNLSGTQVPDLEKAREERRNKICITNMRILIGAIEMYDMDHQTMISSIDSNTIAMLRSQGFLKVDITPPTPMCEYYSDGDLSKTGVVACALHGPCPKSD